MKFAAILAALFLTLTPVSAEAKHRHEKAVAAEVLPAPKILRQIPDGAERVMLTIQNKSSKDLWVYIECVNVLTVEPVPVKAHQNTRINLRCPGGPGGQCLLNHWVVQNGSPPSWYPYGRRQ